MREEDQVPPSIRKFDRPKESSFGSSNREIGFERVACYGADDYDYDRSGSA
jgi:hypothetical protein